MSSCIANVLCASAAPSSSSVLGKRPYESGLVQDYSGSHLPGSSNFHTGSVNEAAQMPGLGLQCEWLENGVRCTLLRSDLISIFCAAHGVFVLLLCICVTD